MSIVIEVMPRQQFLGSFKQSVYQATDTGKAQTGMLQVQVEGLASGSVQVLVEGADFNEETDYVTSDNATLQFTADGTQMLHLMLPRRFMRLHLSITSAANVRAELALPRG